MSASQEFHRALKTWSQIKHRILGGYLSLLLGKVARPATETHRGVFLHCVDGFAGQGRYGDNEKGSPLIAAEISDNPVQPSRKGLLRCINVESRRPTFDNLQEATQTYISKGIVTNLFGTFEEHLDEILRRTGQDPAFFFVDPFGTASTDFSTLERLASRPGGKTEALIRYDDTRVKRLISWASNNLDRLESRAKRTAEAFAAKVRDLTSDEAILSFLNSEPGSRERLIEGYIAEVKRRRIFRHGIYYPIRNPQTGGHRYFLVHFCNFPDGYFHMANFMARAERSVSAPRVSPKPRRQVQGDLFGGNEPAQEPPSCEQLEILGINDQLADAAEQGRIDAIVQALPGLLHTANLLGRTVENRTIYALIVDRFGYAHTRQEWERALKQLHQSRWLKLENGTKDGGMTKVSSSVMPPTSR